MTNETRETANPRRRRYDAAFKRSIVEQTLAPGALVVRIARERSINVNQPFKGRPHFLLAGADTLPLPAQTPPALSLVSVTLAANAPAPATAPSSAIAAMPGQIEITLAGGSVCIQGTVDPAMLRLVLSSLRR